MFVDDIVITTKSGHGGRGIVSFFPMRRGPDGGMGGKGGDIYVRINPHITSLNHFTRQKLYKAPDGKPGEKFNKTGADGHDLFLEVPHNTTVIDLETHDEIDINKNLPQMLICKGGIGGLGNISFKTSTNQIPQHAQPGKEGQTRQIRLVLKLIADIGLVGLPNAGKSSLLNILTAANVRTAPYPFTTLETNLGVCNGKILADIPGLIEGASHGKGLGFNFLKHIEKVNLILHCISVETQDIEKDYQTITGELAAYNPLLAQKKTLILLTKTDLAEKKDIEEKIKRIKRLNPRVSTVSIYDENSIKELKKMISK